MWEERYLNLGVFPSNPHSCPTELKALCREPHPVTHFLRGHQVHLILLVKLTERCLELWGDVNQW